MNTRPPERIPHARRTPILQIRKPSRRPTKEQIAALAEQPTGFLCDAMDGKGALSHELSLLDPAALPTRFCGVALTADNGPDDILAMLAALTQLQPGDVMVSACSGWRGSAVPATGSSASAATLAPSALSLTAWSVITRASSRLACPSFAPA